MTDLATFRDAAIACAVRGDEEARAVLTRAAGGVSSVILVEGVSDAAAVETLAERSSCDLDVARACVIPMGGVTNVAKFVGILRPLGVRLTGLCDVGEERYFRRVFEVAEFFVCVDDLEDELIRSLGPERVQQILDAQGDLPTFRTFQNQPAQRDRSLDRQLRRFFGTTSGRKERYANVLAEALDPANVPQPLRDLLSFATER